MISKLLLFARSPFILLLIIVSITACQRAARDEDGLQLYLPGDLEATLWAESPMFYNPTNMDIDSKGRIWITEAVNYRTYNNDSSNHIHHARGDRVVILEDRDDDGKADDVKIFVQDKDLVSPLGIAVIGNQVFVSCSPNLIVYTDEDGDDIPDKKEIFLTGFGGLDHDHSLHAVVGGADGKLYFTTGNAGPHVVTDKSGWMLRSGSIYTGGSPYNTENKGNMKSDDGKVWVGGLALRINPDGKNLKVLGHNFRNAYELAVDSRGDFWQNDNDDQVVTCRTTWLMEGGNAGYFSSDGTRYWQADQRPGQDVFTAHWHQDDPGVIPAGDRSGAGAPTGVVVYEDDALGENYRGILLSADAGRNVVFAYHPRQHQSGYDLGKRMNFITSLNVDNVDYVWNDSLENRDRDKWFRPSDVAVGIEGAIYVADWYDPVVGGHQMADSTGYGRIYRIQPKAKKLNRPKVDMSSIDGQMAALLSPAINVRFEASQRLAGRGETIIPELKKLIGSRNPYYRARAVWLMARLGDNGLTEVEKLLKDTNVDIRTVAFRSLRQFSSNVIPYAESLADDPSPFVRREILISLTDQPYAVKKPILLSLLKNFDPQDRWFIEAFGTAVAGHEDDLMMDAEKILNPDNVSPEKWNEKMEALVWRLHPLGYVQALAQRAQSNKISVDQRSRAITALAFINDRGAVSAMLNLAKSSLPDVAEQAAYWIGFRQGNDWSQLADWTRTAIDPEAARKAAAMKVRMSNIMDDKMPRDEKRRSAREMARDIVGSKMILGLVAEQKFPSELYDEVGKIMLTSTDQSVRVQASQYFPSDNGHAYAIPTIAKLKADPQRGNQIFDAKCSSCHRVGSSGNDIGPELSLIGKKFDKVALLDAIVNPSAGIVFGYEAWTINTKDGQSYFGFLVGDSETAIVIKDVAGKIRTISTSEIKSRHKAEKSLMPDASSLDMSGEELADVVAYLMNL